MMQSFIFFAAAVLSPFSLAHAAASFSGRFNATRTTRSLRGNRVVDALGSRSIAIGGVAATDSAGILAATNDEAMAHQGERILQQLVPASFLPLGCNKDPCANGEMTWREFNPRVGQLVVIPCGVCVTMDYNKNDMDGNTTDGFYLKLPQGLEIQGSLIFPDRTQYRLTIETPSVVVQGNLDMSAASSRVTGQPLLRFVMTGKDKVAFTPVGINAMACAVENSSGKLVPGDCSVGIKPFVVAGGRIDVRGLPATCKTWVRLKDIDGPRSTLLVPAGGVSTCWSKGAEILITSHTPRMEDAQVRRLVKSPYSLEGDNGLVRLDLDDDIVPPVTALQDEGFEVEVALLSRNIVLQGATDENDSLLGGHFMVMNTPKVAQVVEGIEFNNFGRQGELGRYPIHFHLCQNSPSLISKNLIRKSNQRCIVIHGTNDATVVGNVAFNTAGHCFMTEDGGETDNIFQANLGATTKPVARLINKDDTDAAFPTTFWCSNPMNEWVGNVAAGSQAFGFWFELAETVRPPTLFFPSSKGMNPRTLPLQKFVNNVAHSNNKSALRTYPEGMFPPRTAIVENFRAYKNQGGFFIRHTGNFLFKGGVLADNRVGADMSFVQNITMDGTRIIGLSNRFREIIENQSASYAYDRIVGIELHSRAQAGATIGATIQNVQFMGFGDTKSESNALIGMQPDSASFSNFDSWSRLAGITVPNGMKDPFHFDFNQAVDMGVAGLYLIDSDSSMNPGGGNIQGASTVIANTADMKAFVDMNRCDSFPEYGYLYCKQTCLRTITFAIDPAETEGVRLRLTDLDDSSRSFLYRGVYSPFDQTEFSSTDIERYRIFAAALPSGSYQAEFRNAAGVAIWPNFVETTLKRAFCGDVLAADSVNVVQKAPSTAECQSLISNGNMEASDTDYPFWLHSEAGIQIVRGEGLARSNAIATTSATSANAYIGQYIDIRCLERGAMYDVRAWVKLESINGNIFSCNTGGGNCPSLRLRMRTPVDSIGSDFVERSMFVATEFVQPFDDNSGWNLLQGTITVTAPLARASSVSLTIDRRRSSVKMFVDNVSMTKITPNCNAGLVFNGEISQGTSVFWGRSEASSNLEILTRQSNHALQLSNRNAATEAIVQSIATGCMIKGQMYLVRAKVRVLNANGSDDVACSPVATAGDVKACPRMRLRSTVDIGLPAETPNMHTIAETEYGTIPATNGDVWRTMSGIFMASSFDERADDSVLMVDGVHPKNTLVVDSVSIAPLALNCAQLIRNGGAEVGPTVQFWETFTNNQDVVMRVIQLGNADNHGVLITGRESATDGPAHSIDPRCISESKSWTLRAQMKLVSSETGIPTKCDTTDDRLSVSCPVILVTGYLNGEFEEQKAYSMTNVQDAWIANDMNDYVINNIQVSNVLKACSKIVISYRMNPAWELLIDNVSMKPSA